MTTKIPAKLRKAVDNAFKGIAGVGRANISFDGQDHLSVTVPGWSPTFHKRDLQLGMDVERAAVKLAGLDCRHDGSPVNINQQALFDHLQGHAQRFAETQQEIAEAAASAGITLPIPLGWDHPAAIGHVEVDAQALDELIQELGVEGAAARIAEMHNQIEGVEDDTDGYYDGDEGSSDPTMQPGIIKIEDDDQLATITFQDRKPIMGFDIFLEDENRIATNAGRRRVMLADHAELGRYFDLPIAMRKAA